MKQAVQQDIRKKKTVVWAMVAIGLLVCVYEACLGWKGLGQTGKVETLWSYAFAWLLIYWVACDARLRSWGSPYSKGFLLYLFLAFIVPVYLVRTRGWKGGLLLAGFLLAYALPFLVWPLASLLSSLPPDAC